MHAVPSLSWNWSHKAPRHGFTEIRLDQSGIIPDDFLNLLECCTNLKRFSFNRGAFINGGSLDQDYKTRNVVSTLARVAWHSLEDISIAGDHHRRSLPTDGEKHYDLTMFQKLRNIYMDHCLFHNNFTSCCITCPGRHTYHCNRHPLVSPLRLFPASTENVKLSGPLDSKWASAMIDCLAELKEEKQLPNLTTLALQSPITQNAEVVEACKVLGVKLVYRQWHERSYYEHLAL